MKRRSPTTPLRLNRAELENLLLYFEIFGSTEAKILAALKRLKPQDVVDLPGQTYIPGCEPNNSSTNTKNSEKHEEEACS